MIILTNEEMTLNILYNWGKGKMKIWLPKFFEDPKMFDTRKIIKLIRDSQTPEEEEKIWRYIEAEMETIEDRMKSCANKSVDASTKAKELEPDLARLIEQRDRWKKSSDPYKELMKGVKTMRAEINHQKAVAKSQLSDFNRLMRQKDFYVKLKEFYKK